MSNVSICTPFDLPHEFDLDSEQLANQVKFYRIKHGLTQLELSEMIDCSVNTISAIENGGSCSIVLALRLSCVFRCSVDDLFQIFYSIRFIDPVSNLAESEDI